MRNYFLALLLLAGLKTNAQRKYYYLETERRYSSGDTVLYQRFMPIKLDSIQKTVVIHDTVYIEKEKKLPLIDVSEKKVVKNTSLKVTLEQEMVVFTYQTLKDAFYEEKDFSLFLLKIIACVESSGFVYNKNMPTFNKLIDELFEKTGKDRPKRRARPLEIRMLDGNGSPIGIVKQRT